MDALTGLIRGPRAQGAFLLHVSFDPPWSLRVEDEAPLTLIAVTHGHAWITLAGEAPLLLETGDVAFVRGPDPYTLADSPDSPPHVVVLPDQRCVSLDGRDLEQSMRLGVRTWGNARAGASRMLVGTYGLDTEIGRRLLETLPTLAVLKQDDWDAALVHLLADEMRKELPGQEAILDRLLDLLLVSGVRAWLARPESNAPGWVLASGDPAVAEALRMLYDDPAHAWTVGALAKAVGMSRAGLARRFTDVVGAPPMTFLTEWRLTLAADLLCEPGETIASVAEQVGYASPYALSSAFKRVRGVSPKAHRHARAGTASPPHAGEAGEG